MALIAIVDDDRGVRTSLGDFLRSLGHTACLFPTGEALLASPALADLQGVICDLRLGEGMDGLALAQEISLRREDIPVILTPALADESLRLAAAAAGMYAVVEKPFDMDALAAALDAALAQRPA